MKERYKDSKLFNVEFAKPIEVTGFHPYMEAWVDPSVDGEYVLNEGWCNDNEYKPVHKLHDLLYELRKKTYPTHKMDNKVVYIYTTEKYGEVAVLLKDNIAIFGRRESVRLLKY